MKWIFLSMSLVVVVAQAEVVKKCAKAGQDVLLALELRAGTVDPIEQVVRDWQSLKDLEWHKLPQVPPERFADTMQTIEALPDNLKDGYEFSTFRRVFRRAVIDGERAFLKLGGAREPPAAAAANPQLARAFSIFSAAREARLALLFAKHGKGIPLLGVSKLEVDRLRLEKVEKEEETEISILVFKDIGEHVVVRWDAIEGEITPAYLKQLRDFAVTMTPELRTKVVETIEFAERVFNRLNLNATDVEMTLTKEGQFYISDFGMVVEADPQLGTGELSFQQANRQHLSNLRSILEQAYGI
jgi:hypothetical protein